MAQAVYVRDAGLDTAKAAAILLVVCLHVQVRVPADPAVVHAAFSFFYYKLGLAAVPLFFTVSLFLFISKYEQRGVAYFGRRMLRLVKLYVFWVAVQTTLSVITRGEWPDLSLRFFMRGGSSLPIVGGSVFYFLFDLLVLTTLAFVLSSLPRRSREPVAWAGLALGAAYLAASPWIGELLPAFLAAFLVYVPLAWLLCHRPGLFRWPWLFAGLFVVTGLLEVVLYKYVGFGGDTFYARVNALVGVLAVYSLCARFPLDRPWVRWLSVHSLGIFALHKYVQYLGYQVLHGLGYGYDLVAVAFVPSLLIFVWTLLLTVLAVALLRRTPLVRYVA